VRTAALLVKHGYKADASALIQDPLNTTRDSELKTKLEQLRQQTDLRPTARIETPTPLRDDAT